MDLIESFKINANTNDYFYLKENLSSKIYEATPVLIGKNIYYVFAKNYFRNSDYHEDSLNFFPNAEYKNFINQCNNRISIIHDNY